MHTKTYFVSFSALLLTFFFPLLIVSCGESDDNAIEYVNKDVAYHA